MKIDYGFTQTEFGLVFLAFEDSRICQISFSKKKAVLVEKLKIKWPRAQFQLQSTQWIFNHWQKIRKLIRSEAQKKRLILGLSKGTEFQKKVWLALLQIPKGKTSFYSEIAEKINSPNAVRAVGTAVGANPLGFLIPCHRVLPKSGGLGGFAWGVDLKQRMLESEQAFPRAENKKPAR